MNEKAAKKVYKNSNLIRELAFTLLMFIEYEVFFDESYNMGPKHFVM